MGLLTSKLADECRAKEFGHYTRRKLLMDWTKKTFHETKELEQVCDLIQRDKAPMHQLTAKMVDLNASYALQFDRLCDLAYRFAAQPPNPLNIPAAL